MRTMYLLLLLPATITIARAQPHSRRVYLDLNMNLTSKKKSLYTALVTRDAGRWVAKASYHDGSPLLVISFKDRKLTIKDGHYTLYYLGGKPRQDGDFTNDEADGIWQAWYNNGQLEDSGRVVQNRFSGLWKHWYANGQLKNNHSYSIRWHAPPVIAEQNHDSDYIPPDKPLVPSLHVSGSSDGAWQSWYENGRPESIGTYRNDTITGVWKWFRENGQPATVETYTNGKLSRLDCYDENGVFTGNSCSISKSPVFTGAGSSLRQYIVNQLKRTCQKPVDIGPAVITFKVTKTGKISNLVVSNARTPGVAGYITLMFDNMPAWLPAMSHNRAIDYTITLSLF